MYGPVPFEGVAEIVADWPMQIVVPPAAARLTGPLTNTVTVSVPWQLFASVTWTVYVVVADGNAFVVAAFGEPRLPAGNQLYVVPPPVLSCVVSPEQMVISGPAKTLRLLEIATVIVSLDEQPLAPVPVTINVVLTVGVATGFAIVVSLKPVDGDQM